MKYKVGDIVRVRDWDDMEKQYGLDAIGSIDVFPHFTKEMKLLCGKKLKVVTVGDFYKLENAEKFNFIDEMLLPVGAGKDKVMNIDLCEIFGVKPDRVFHIKGSNFLIEDEYRVHEKVLQYSVGDSWIQSSRKINEFHDFEVVLYYATNAEKTILRSLDEKYRNGYVARDLCKNIFAYENIPETRKDYYVDVRGDADSLPYPHLFQFIQFNTGAVRIKDIIGE